MLDLIFGNGVLLSLHDAAPGETGAPVLDGPHAIPHARLSIRRMRLVNIAQIRLPQASASGTVRYIGLWTRQRRFVLAVPVQSQGIAGGLETIIAPGRLEVRIG